MRIYLFTLLCCVLNHAVSFAQCGPVIAAFPYNESFESGTAGWSSGGTSNDWAWGTPSKSFIQTAGSGTKCWVTGSLNGSFYSYGQRSYVTSPCFNFSSLQNPHVKMKIYWEGENQYDGTTFQYSLNNGSTWINVGTNNDPVDCLNANWFNQGNINALSTLASPRHGWAGTVLPTNGGCFGGGGSTGWVTAQHCMPYLAGQSNVQFRFAFGAGTVCNDYDGFAFDDFTLEEAPANAADFSFACSPTPLGYQFLQTSALCPNTFSWNFGDPGSGANNVSSSPNPMHVFSSPGTYTISLTVSGPCNQSSTVSKIITTLSGNGFSLSPLCNNTPTGTITYTASGANGNVTYTLQPAAQSNGSGVFTNLLPATYTVMAMDAAGCSISSSFALINPPALNWNSFSAIPISCFGNQNGQIQAQTNGGSGTLSYTLQPGNVVNSAGNFTNLQPGNYTVTVSDGNGCTLSSLASILQPQPLAILSFNPVSIACFGLPTGALTLSAGGGTGGYSYTLFPGSLPGPGGNFQSLSSGTYTVVVSDANNCSLTSVFTLTQAPELLFTSLSTSDPSCVPGNDGALTISASGGSGPLTFSIGGMFSSANSFSNLPANTYTITVKDANNCSKSTAITLQNPGAPLLTQSSHTDLLCHGQENGIIQVTANGVHPIQYYELQPLNLQSANGQFSMLPAQTYTITVMDSEGCTVTTTITVAQPDPILLSPLEYQPLPCLSEYLGTLQAMATGGTGGYSFQLLPVGETNNTGLFELQTAGITGIRVTDQNGCRSEVNYTVPERICCEQVFLPSAFSPNGDGKNDEFRLLNAAGIELKKMLVVNRWGQIVFEALHAEDRWDGTLKGLPADIGTYFYWLHYSCLSNGKEYRMKGDLILIR